MKMKKIILSLTLAAFCILFANAQEAVKPETKAGTGEFAFEEETHDYGTIKQGDNGSFDFKFKNIGKEPIIISKAVGSCGCTVPSWPKEPILPGASSVIKVTYDTKRIGAFSKSVTITSNAKTETKMLSISGNVKEVPAVETFPAKKMGEGSPLENN
jgi:hypothetical protein